MLAARLYQVQVVEGARYATLAEENRISARLIAPPRGRMLDRFGTVVAGNRLNWRALLIAEQTDDVGATLDISPASCRWPTTSAPASSASCTATAASSRSMVREFLTWDEMAAIEVNAPDLPGILVDVGTTRLYPVRRQARACGGLRRAARRGGRRPTIRCCAARHPDRPRRAGEVARPRPARPRRRGAARGQRGRPGDPRAGPPGRRRRATSSASPSTPGCRSRCCDRLGDESASAVVLDCRNGEVLAMAHQPVLRSVSLFNSGVSQAQWVEWTQQPPHAAASTSAAAGVYAPGSTFKMAVALAALEAKAIIARPTGIHCPGYPRPRRHALPLLAQGRPRLARSARRAQAQLRRVSSTRPRGAPASTAIAAMAHRFGLGVELDDRPARRAPGLNSDARVAPVQGPGLEHRRHHRQRHRPGLHPGHAAAARDLCLARRHRARGGAASDAGQRRRAAARTQSGRLARPRPAGQVAATRAARACGPW